MWIFGYGSLVWRPAFAHLERRPAFIDGWARRFWQGSPDHRGLPEAPGRVVTLIRAPKARCWGMAYRVDAEGRDTLLAALDHREQAGYERHDVELAADDDWRATALMYVAAEGNGSYLGPATVDDIARHVQRARGPSGTNSEYVLRLADGLRAIGARDAHVFAVEEALRSRQAVG